MGAEVVVSEAGRQGKPGKQSLWPLPFSHSPNSLPVLLVEKGQPKLYIAKEFSAMSHRSQVPRAQKRQRWGRKGSRKENNKGRLASSY